MNTKDFYYDLPEELIAQTPLAKRDSSKLLVLPLNEDQIEHKHFGDILDYLRPDDCLIMNNSRVLPARIFGVKETGSLVELLLLKNIGNDEWECLVKPGKKARVGAELKISEFLSCKITNVLEDGNRIVKFFYPEGRNIYEILDEVGTMPLPPYIKEKLEDQERYQTVYAKEIGSAAAPTAGLHFTDELMQIISQMGVKIGYVTLHVGLGTFRPVKVEDVSNHKMHTESYFVPPETIDLINETRNKGGRIISVGTTSTRTLESAFDEKGNCIKPYGDTDIFIYPGYKFKMIDGLITNFHLPESTLIMLVSALAGKDKVLEAYRIAVEEKYRFFSFGDAMLII